VKHQSRAKTGKGKKKKTLGNRIRGLEERIRVWSHYSRDKGGAASSAITGGEIRAARKVGKTMSIGGAVVPGDFKKVPQ